MGRLFAQFNGSQGIRLIVNGLISIFVAGAAMGGLIIVEFYLVGD